MWHTTRVGSWLAVLAALLASGTAVLASTEDNPPEDLLPSVFDLAVIGSDGTSVAVETRDRGCTGWISMAAPSACPSAVPRSGASNRMHRRRGSCSRAASRVTAAKPGVPVIG